MVRFSCPRCRSILEAPDHKGGDKIDCPKCQQRLQVPLPPRNKTILAPLDEHQPAPTLNKPIAIPLGPPPVPPPLPPTLPAADDTPPPLPPTRRFVRAVLVLSLLAVGVVIVGAIIFAGHMAYNAIAAEPGEQVEQRSRTRCEEEEIVKKYILDNSNDPKSVEFDRWGPHDLSGDLGPYFFPHFGKWTGEPMKVVRVCYRSLNAVGARQFHDFLFFVQSGKVIEHSPSAASGGDNWKESFKDLPKQRREAQARYERELEEYNREVKEFEEFQRETKRQLEEDASGHGPRTRQARVTPDLPFPPLPPEGTIPDSEVRKRAETAERIKAMDAEIKKAQESADAASDERAKARYKERQDAQRQSPGPRTRQQEEQVPPLRRQPMPPQ